MNNIKYNYQSEIDKINRLVSNISNSKNVSQVQILRSTAIDLLNNLLNQIDITEYLLIDSQPLLKKDTYINAYFTLGTLYKNRKETEIQINGVKDIDGDFTSALNCFTTILRIQPEDVFAIKQIVSIYTQIVFYSSDNIQNCLKYLTEALFYAPDNETLHYNMAFLFEKINNLEMAVYHYRLSIELSKYKIMSTTDVCEKQELEKMLLNNYNGLSNVYGTVKNWPTALYYLQKACEINKTDPDINNKLGIVYTEMRRTDLAEIAYKTAIENYESAFITQDNQLLLSNIFLNYGHMHSYNGDNMKSIEYYNKSLKSKPDFNLPFQNKLLNLCYIFDELEDKMYITNQHVLINKLYGRYNVPAYNFMNLKYTKKINIGIISGDFINHPVSYFISTFLKMFSIDLFDVFCYSECIIDTKQFNQNIKFVFIKNKNSHEAADIIYKDKIHILIDLSGHTAFNRLDIFKLKPSPCQISYIGYPFTTGLNEMDYRITDEYCDNKLVSQRFYSENLLYLKNCFLCYDPCPINVKYDDYLLPKLPEIQPYIKNRYITFGCFNRLNKITYKLIKIINDVLVKNSNAKFVFKTKALLNKTIRDKFLEKFDKSVHKRIQILDCTVLHDQHLLTYNDIDIAIDTFPYSGTTTSCEALLMGVPVFTFYDSEYYYHAQNVTASILHNSDLSFYVLNKKEQLFDKIRELQKLSEDDWYKLKTRTRSSFLNGKVCDKISYMNNITQLFQSITKNDWNKLN